MFFEKVFLEYVLIAGAFLKIDLFGRFNKMSQMELEKARKHFLAKVNKSSGRIVNGLTECWFREGVANSHGYGNYQSTYMKSRGITYSHQAAYYLFKDQTYKPSREMPLGHICELIGNPHGMCCNPEHLSHITRTLNISQRDENLGAYQPKGADAPGSKFSLEEARAIQQRHLKGEEYKDIATSLEVNRRTIERICIGDTYKELGDIRPLIKKQNEDNDKRIIQMNTEGKSRKEICEKCKRSPAYVSGIITRSNKSPKILGTPHDMNTS